jgi:hypothetical protein
VEKDGEEDEDKHVAITDLEMRKKKAKDKGGGSQGTKCKTLEDMCFYDYWKVMRIDPVTGSN